MLSLKYTKNNNLAVEPERFNSKCVGYNLFSPETVTVPPLDVVKIDTGIIFQMEGSFYGQIENVLKKKSYFQVIAGVIDPGYRGSVIVALFNFTNDKHIIFANEIIAQIIFIPVILPELIYTEQSTEDINSVCYLKCTKTSPSAFIPTRFENSSIGFDLHTLKDVCVQPFGIAQVDTGIILEFGGGGFYGLIRDKSGFSTKRKMHVIDGIMDPSYNGTIIVYLKNLSKEVQHIFAEEKIAQIIFLSALLPSLVYKDEIDMNTTRGNRGFQSGDVAGLCNETFI